MTTLFDEMDGATTMTVTVLAASKEVRDAVLASGMEHGAAEGYYRLAGALGVTLPSHSGKVTPRSAGKWCITLMLTHDAHPHSHP